MRFFTPTPEDDSLGVFVSVRQWYKQPKMRRLVSEGVDWCIDNDAYSRGFMPDEFFPWLESVKAYRDTCLFVAVPDVVGDSIQTLDNWRHWLRFFDGWPVAFVAQDGQENLPLPTDYDALFVGGTTEWKVSPGAVQCIKRAQSNGKHIHIGRVNWLRRYNLFRVLDGSDSFTCDGTRSRFDGREKTHAKWKEYMAQEPLVAI